MRRGPDPALPPVEWYIWLLVWRDVFVPRRGPNRYAILYAASPAEGMIQHVRGRLIAASRKVQPGNAGIVEHPEAIQPFWRHIYQAFFGCCADEKHFLSRNEFDMLF